MSLLEGNAETKSEAGTFVFEQTKCDYGISNEWSLPALVRVIWIALCLLGAWIFVVMPSFGSGVDLSYRNETLNLPNVVFTALLVLHGGFYGVYFLLPPLRRWFWLYFAGQCTLIVCIHLILIPANALIVGGILYIALTGEILVAGSSPARIMVTVVGAVLCFMGGLALRAGWDVVHHELLYILPLLMVTAGCVVFYLRLIRAHERSSALLRELEVAHSELARYAMRVEELTLLNERQRLARELHDTLAQGLIGLTMQLDVADALLAEQNVSEAQEIVQRAMERSRATLADARRAIDDLRLPAVRSVSCHEALLAKVEHFTSTTGIPCEVEVGVLNHVMLAPSFCEHLVHVVAESLLNIARHAQAHHVRVQAAVQAELGMLTIEICDDGVGFMVNAIPSAGHYGLTGLRERARLVGGTFTIMSKIGEGTTIRFTLPRAVDASLDKGNGVKEGLL
jgi:NarL family two-component system sensor histidine kinase YdfH